MLILEQGPRQFHINSESIYALLPLIIVFLVTRRN